jgi:predicted RNA-binding Zn-ribbon protein involved in translation (DUF1610 family)
MSEQKEIKLDIDEWMALSPKGVPIHPPANWVGVVAYLSGLDEISCFRVMHNITRIELSTSQAIQFKDVPTSISVPSCPLCGQEMVLRSSRFGAFFGCPAFPACKEKVPAISCLRFEPLVSLKAKGLA